MKFTLISFVIRWFKLITFILWLNRIYKAKFLNVFFFFCNLKCCYWFLFLVILKCASENHHFWFGFAYCCPSFNDTATWSSLSAFRLKLDVWVLCGLSRHQTELQPSNVSVCNGNAIMAVSMHVTEHWPFWLFVSVYISI